MRVDGVKLAVFEVMGTELDEPKLEAFSGALNALDFSVQFLVRQHPPRLGRTSGIPSRSSAGRSSGAGGRGRPILFRELLTRLEARDGILDRRFYAVCVRERADDLRSLLARSGTSVHPLDGRRLRMFFLSSILGGSPTESVTAERVHVEIGGREIRVDGRFTRSLHLSRWPRSLSPGFLQRLMSAGVAMDIAIHLSPIPAEQAARTLEWQKVRFESARSLSIQRGRSLSPEAEIALEDVMRLRDDVQRGRERLFNASLSITLHAPDSKVLKEMTQRVRAHFASSLGKIDRLTFRQREGILSTLPMGLNAIASWRTLDTSSLARLFPFSPPDLDTRKGTLYGIDMRSGFARRLRIRSTRSSSTPTPRCWPAPERASRSPPSSRCSGASRAA